MFYRKVLLSLMFAGSVLVSLAYEMDSDSVVNLQEVEITARQDLTKSIEGGYSYNMAADKRAKGDNLLHSLNYVPFITALPDGKITLRGSDNYLFYLNGRPFDFAMGDPAMILHSIKGKDIRRVEVITSPTVNFPNVSTPIINIIAREDLLKGLRGTVGASGATNPNARGNALVAGTLGKVGISVSYDYSLTGQRKQRMEGGMDYFKPNGDVNSIISNGTGRGDWHSHIIRAMGKWEINGNNSIYADIHGNMTKTVSTNNWRQIERMYDGATLNNRFSLHDNTKKGNVETNIIWRNYFKDFPSLEKLSIGYRYTYNPDKRNYKIDSEESGVASTELQTADGGLHNHSLNLNWNIPFLNYHILSLSFSDNLRYADSKSSSSAEDLGTDLKYDNNIGVFNILYTGYIRRLVVSAEMGAEYSHLSYELRNIPGSRNSRNDFLVKPGLAITWNSPQSMMLSARFSTSFSRPSISQLNPFQFDFNAVSGLKGSPDIKTATMRSIMLTAYKSFGRLSIYSTASWTHTTNLILGYTVLEEGRFITSYGNVGNANSWQISANMDYTPRQWLNLGAYLSFGKRHVRGKDGFISQNDWQYTISPRVNFYLPRQWYISADYGIYKQTPELYCSNKNFSIYSFRVGKSFFNGALSFSACADSPFNRYTKIHSVTALHDGRSYTTHFTTGRSFSLSLSYSFSKGKDPEIRRDSSLRSTDISTGVR